jgi:putative transcriptional regulator
MRSLTGQILISMPQLQDPFFARSIVYLCAHSDKNGAVGLIVNKLIESFTIDDLLAQLKIEPFKQSDGCEPVHFGGPVSTGNAFVLHSADYQIEATLRTDDRFAMTATLDILRSMSQGKGPLQRLVALGYAGWGPGQLETEIQANGWLLGAADSELVFDADYVTKWERALAKLGINPALLSGQSGRA